MQQDLRAPDCKRAVLSQAPVRPAQLRGCWPYTLIGCRAVLDRLRAFLPAMHSANADLEERIQREGTEAVSMEAVDGAEAHIQMVRDDALCSSARAVQCGAVQCSHALCALLHQDLMLPTMIAQLEGLPPGEVDEDDSDDDDDDSNGDTKRVQLLGSGGDSDSEASSSSASDESDSGESVSGAGSSDGEAPRQGAGMETD